MAKRLSAQQIERLLEAARAAQERAHAPYSEFRVGAAILDEQDRVFSGCNVENAAYPLGLCAEAVALGNLVVNGGHDVAAILVLGDGDTPPCGACRQRMRELAALDTPILVADRQGVRGQYTLEQLLPASFGPEHLKK